MFGRSKLRIAGQVLISVSALLVLLFSFTINVRPLVAPAPVSDVNEEVTQLGSFGTGREWGAVIDTLDDVPYVLVSEEEYGWQGTVKKFENGSWSDVGTPGFTVGRTMSDILVISENEIYVAVDDSNYSGLGITGDGFLRVYLYDGTSWSLVNYVTIKNFGSSRSTSLTKVNDEAYLSYKLGNYVYVFSVNASGLTSKGYTYLPRGVRAASNGTDFMLMKANYTSFTISKLVDGAFEDISTYVVPDRKIQSVYDLAVTKSGVPMIGFQENDYIKIKQFVNGSWEDYLPEFNQAGNFVYHLELDSSDQPYAMISNRLNQNDVKLNIVKLSSQGWEEVGGSEPITNKNYLFHDMTISASGKLFMPSGELTNYNHNYEVEVFQSSPFIKLFATTGDTEVNGLEFQGEGGESLTYSISGGVDQGMFGINNTTGVLTFDGVLNHLDTTDSNQDGVYELEVTVSDNETPVPKTKTISVLVEVISGRNRPPVVEPKVYGEWYQNYQNLPILPEKGEVSSGEGEGDIRGSIGILDSGAGGSGTTQRDFDIAYDPLSQTPYVVHYDLEDNANVTVHTYNEGEWQRIGASGIQGQREASKLSIATGPTGDVFVAYAVEYAEPYFSDLYNSQVGFAVQKYDSTSDTWQLVGEIQENQYNVSLEDEINLQIDQSNNPSVIYRNSDAFDNRAGFIIAKTFNGTEWVNLGSGDGIVNNLGSERVEEDFTANIAYQVSPAGEHFVSYKTLGGQVEVRKYNTTTNSWDLVGQENITNGVIVNSTIGFEVDSNPYISVLTSENEIQVFRYGENGWVSVGENIATTANATHNIVVDEGNTPYLALFDQSPSVYKFDGLAWEEIVQPFGSVALVEPHLFLNQLGDPVVAGFDTDNEVIQGYSIDSQAIITTLENTSVVDNFVVIDPNISQTQSYQIVGGDDQDKFVVDTTGRLSFVSPPDFETPVDVDNNNSYELIIKVVDDGTPNLSTTTKIQVEVLDVDDDTDNVESDIENAAPNGGDGNADGVQDAVQNNVVSLPSVTSQYVTLDGNGCELSNVGVLSEAEVAVDKEYEYPLGLVEFNGKCNELYLDVFVYSDQEFVLRKYIQNSFQTINLDSVEMVESSTNKLYKYSYRLVDGGDLDAGPAGDGEILDPVGFGIAIAENDTNTGPNKLIRTGGY